jgi:hypothetical protein
LSMYIYILNEAVLADLANRDTDGNNCMRYIYLMQLLPSVLS